MKRIVYFDKNIIFRDSFIEFMSSDNNILNISIVEKEDDLYNAAQESQGDIFLIDLYSLGKDVIPKFTKLISLIGNTTTIIILSSSGKVTAKYLRNTGEALWFDKNEELEEVVEAIKLIQNNNDFRI